MKVHAKIYFILFFLISSVASCGPKKTASHKEFKFQVSALLSSDFVGGSFVQGISNSNTTIVKLDSNNSAEFTPGLWDFKAVLFEGPTPFSGRRVCGEIKINLTEVNQDVTMSLTEANCSQASFLALIQKINTAYNDNFFTVTPNTGALSGGSLVRIEGKNITADAVATFGGTACSEIIVLSSTALTCKTPPHTEGNVSVVVTTPSNSITRTVHNAYTYSENRRAEFISAMNLAGMSGSIAVDSSHNVFYCDGNGAVIRKIAPDGTHTVFVGNGSFTILDGTGSGASFLSPQFITIDSNNNLYVIDWMQIRKITPAGLVTTIGQVVESGGSLKGMTADAYGNVYYVWDDTYGSGNKIQKMLPNGSVTTIAGSINPGFFNANGVSATFNGPNDLVIDSAGNIIVADVGNYAIRKISSSFDVTTIAGGSAGYQDGIGADAKFAFYMSYPYGHMGIDSSDNIFIGDVGSNYGLIRKVTPAGEVSTYCGTQTYIGPVGPCHYGSVYSRFGVAVGPDGSVYFADGGGLSKILR